MTDRDAKLQALLREQLSLARRAAEVLAFSRTRVATEADITRLAASPEGRERLESLTSRYARLADLLTQQIFRVSDRIELLEEGSIIDRLNRAEKRRWIDSAERWKEIRLLRNRISHEYADEAWLAIVRDAWRLTPELLECVNRASRNSATGV